MLEPLTGPDQSRCADWWSLPDSETTGGGLAAGGPSREAQHPEEQGSGVSLPGPLKLGTFKHVTDDIPIPAYPHALGSDQYLSGSREEEVAIRVKAEVGDTPLVASQQGKRRAIIPGIQA